MMTIQQLTNPTYFGKIDLNELSPDSDSIRLEQLRFARDFSELTPEEEKELARLEKGEGESQTDRFIRETLETSEWDLKKSIEKQRERDEKPSRADLEQAWKEFERY